MDDTTINNREGYLYLTGRRGYSAYEVAVQNGFVGTEEEWLESLKGESGTPFDELTPEQKEEIRGPQGKSAYQVAVDNGYIGTEQEWVDSFLTPDGYIQKQDVIDNLESTETQKPLSANQGKELKSNLNELEVSNDNLKKAVIDNVKIIIPNNFGSYSGDCILIKAYDKNILIDTHRVQVYNELKQFLQRNNVKTIDYLILTHYHDDHVGNVVNLISDNYIDINSYVYLPGYSTLIDDNPSTLQYYTNVNNAINNSNIPHSIPTEESTLEIEDFKITFYNCEESIFTSMEVTNYNDCSTVCLCEYGNEKMLFTGDCTEKPFDRFVDNQMFNFKIQVYKIEHHGFSIDNQAIKFMQQITPDLAIQTMSKKDAELGKSSRASTMAYLMQSNTPIYSQHINTNDIIIDVYKTRFNVVQGKQNYSQGSSNAIINYYYVDSSTTNTVQNGTQSNPFMSLGQALGKINKLPYARNYINLAAGTYTEETNIAINGVHIEFTGDTTTPSNVVIRNKMFISHSHIVFNGITFDNVNGNPLEFTYSNVTLVKCNITSSTQTVANVGITGRSSKITVRETNIDYCNQGIYSQYDNLFTTDLTIQNCNTAFRLNRTEYANDNLTLTNNITNYQINNSLELSNRIEKSKLLNSETIVPSVNTNIVAVDNYTNYNTLLFSFGALGNGTWETHTVNGYHNGKFSLNNEFVISTSEGKITFKVTSGNTLTVTARDNELLSVRQIIGLNI